MKRSFVLLIAAATAAALSTAAPTAAKTGDQLSGAIFTTDVTGVPVNLNHYQAKEDVYLNGGPGINAPDNAAGLPAGIYTFQVTDPSGKTLLSTDPVACRQVQVDGSGRFVSVAPSGACAHQTGIDGEDLGITVQLFPYDDTPNNGGVYKVWLTPTTDLNCSAAGNKHCFVPGFSKTDNFKVKSGPIVEIDTRFWAPGADDPLDGMKVVWYDTVGASNIKYSEYNPSILAFHEAHVEAAEQGTHGILIQDQPGCTIGSVKTPANKTLTPTNGEVYVKVNVGPPNGDITYFVDVYCT
jgi:hypothetical protein